MVVIPRPTFVTEIRGMDRRAGAFPKADPQEIIDHWERVWVWSDTHFWHANIVKYQNRPEDHTRLMFKAWMEKVLPHDVLLHLGDVAHGISLQDLDAKFPRNLPGQVFLVVGNHDRNSRLEVFASRKWKVLNPFELVFGDELFQFTHEPLEERLVTNGIINVHGHIHGRESPGDRYINVSVEKLGYEPVLLKGLLERKLAELNAPGVNL